MLRVGRVPAEMFGGPKQRSRLSAVTPAATTAREDGGEPAPLPTQALWDG